MTKATRRPHVTDHQLLDLSAARHVLVFGDVHGNLALVRAELDRHDFDNAHDAAICVGDWMDRGDDGLVKTRDFLEANHGVLWTRGNHEQILDDACHGHDGRGRWTRDDAEGLLIMNGGAWALNHMGEDDHADADLVAFGDMLNTAPVALTIITPAGRRVGIVHAGVPGGDWNKMIAALEGPDPMRYDMANRCMWDRDDADTAKARRKDGQPFGHEIKGIDHVFHGHTRMGTTPVTFGNVSWIDTGAYKTGVLTMINIDAFLADLGEPSPFAR